MQQTLINGVTNYWCRTKGIHSKDLDSHPKMDDVILLMKWRDAMWAKCNASERAFYNSIWGYVYSKKRPLKQKYLKKLEILTIQATTRHTSNQDIKARQRKKIIERINQIRQQRAPV